MEISVESSSPRSSGAFGTYLFSGPIEAKRQRRIERRAAERQALDALKSWRQSFLRWTHNVSMGRPSVLGGNPDSEKSKLAAVLFSAAEAFPEWKASLLRAWTVTWAGDDALLVQEIGVYDHNDQSSSDAWFSAFLDLGTHFDPAVVNGLAARSLRFTDDRDDSWRWVFNEAEHIRHVLEADTLTFLSAFPGLSKEKIVELHRHRFFGKGFRVSVRVLLWRLKAQRMTKAPQGLEESTRSAA